MRKKREIKRLRIPENPKLYTKEDPDSIDYVQGNGFYAKYQDKRTRKKYPLIGYFLRVLFIAKIYCIYVDN